MGGGDGRQWALSRGRAIRLGDSFSRDDLSLIESGRWAIVNELHVAHAEKRG